MQGPLDRHSAGGGWRGRICSPQGNRGTITGWLQFSGKEVRKSSCISKPQQLPYLLPEHLSSACKTGGPPERGVHSGGVALGSPHREEKNLQQTGGNNSGSFRVFWKIFLLTTNFRPRGQWDNAAGKLRFLSPIPASAGQAATARGREIAPRLLLIPTNFARRWNTM